MKNKALSTITVGIPAYNEEKNIENLLKSILAQKEIGYRIEKIIVISDGSTDDTVQSARKISDKRLEVIHVQNRIGKSTHLNRLFQKLKSDILVLFDADVVLYNSDTIRLLIQPLLENRKVGLVGGNAIQHNANGLVARAIKVGYDCYSELRKQLNAGNNVYTCIGQVLALSRNFAKSVHVPKNVMSNDSYLYFACLHNDFIFKHVDDAKVYYLAPVKIVDHISQNERFAIARKRLIQIFGNRARDEYYIKPSLIFRYQLLAFVQSPFLSTLLFILNIYSLVIMKINHKHFTAVWPIAWSTKQKVPHSI